MELELGAEMMNELTEAARECGISQRQFALESLESVLASRRLPRMETAGGYGGRHYGHLPKHEDEREFEDAAEAGLVVHGFLL